MEISLKEVEDELLDLTREISELKGRLGLLAKRRAVVAVVRDFMRGEELLRREEDPFEH